MNLKYAAIIYSYSMLDILDKVTDLETQEYAPSSYFVLLMKDPLESEMQNFLIKMAQINKPWKFKTHPNDEPAEYLIDEFFRTNSIKNRFCVYIRGNVAYDFSSRLFKIVQEQSEKWLFYLDNHQAFYTKLMQYLSFNILEDGLIKLNQKDRIYY